MLRRPERLTGERIGGKAGSSSDAQKAELVPIVRAGGYAEVLDGIVEDDRKLRVAFGKVDELGGSANAISLLGTFSD